MLIFRGVYPSCSAMSSIHPFSVFFGASPSPASDPRGNQGAVSVPCVPCVLPVSMVQLDPIPNQLMKKNLQQKGSEWYCLAVFCKK